MRLLRSALTLALLLSPQAALACGGMVSESGGAELVGFEALLRWDGDREELVVSVGYTSGDPEFAWLMPLPSPPKVSEAKDDLIAKAFQITAPPKPEEEGSEDETATAPPMVGGAPGVEVIGRETVGGLRFVTLGGGSAAEVTRWMRRHRFAFHDRQEPVLQDYLDRGWVVVAARGLQGNPGAASLVPVRFRFRTDEPVYPLALAGTGHEEQNLDVTLFVLSPFRPTATTFDERIVRPSETGDFPPPANQLELRYSAPLGEGPADRMQATLGTWLTRYEATFVTTDLTTDLVFARSPVQSSIDYPELVAGQGQNWILWIAISLVLLVLAIWISLRMAHRRRAEEAPRMPTQVPPGT
jgi:Uncharacterized protein conserved in bacteria (DUF2330)